MRVLGRQQPSLTQTEIREALVAEFGPDAMLSDSTLRRYRSDIGCHNQHLPSNRIKEQVTELSGGGGLVLLLAAMIETFDMHQMAEAVNNLSLSPTTSKRAGIRRCSFPR